MNQYQEGDYQVTEYDDGSVDRVLHRPAPEPGPRPALVITALSSSAPAGTLIDLPRGEVTCAAGTLLTASVELRGEGGVLIPLSDSFRMPVKARDGREFVVLAPFLEGLAQIGVPFQESGIWQISEELINSGLPPQAQMSFAGLAIYVLVAPA